MSAGNTSIIEVKVMNEKVATIVVALNASNLFIDNQHKNCEEVLQRILQKIAKLKLPLHLPPIEGPNKDGKFTITDMYKECSPGDENYEYALAQEINRYKLFGKPIRCIVRKSEEPILVK
jgi:hypothetical protein